MKAFKQILAAIAMGVFAVLPQPGWAEDIDLYVAGEGQLGTAPNVLIILDNSANYANVNSVLGAKNGIAEWNALKSVLNSLAAANANINVGVMLGTASGSAQGGYIRFAVRPVKDLANVVNTATMVNTLADFFANGEANAQPPINQQIEKINASGPLYDDYFDDAFRYFYGKQKFGPFAENSPSDSRDRGGTPQDYRHEGANHPAFAASLGSYAYTDAADTVYNPPGDASKGCARNFIIFIANGFPSPADSSSAWATRTSNLAATLGVTFAAADLVQLPQKLVSGSNLGQDVQKNHWADELAKLMFKYGVPAMKSDGITPIVDANGVPIRNSIVTYTLDVIDSPQEHDKSALLSAIARQGQGKYFSAQSALQIEAALAKMFAEIQAVNSVFTSATLPVSVNLQGIFENQIFFGVFRPDGQSRPRWYGNLKQYQFGLETTVAGTTSLFLADSQGQAALNANTGFITDSAVSYWTAGNSYWSFSPRGNTATPDSDAPDGPLVEKGGAAQVARTKFANATFSPSDFSQNGRNIYTCLTGCLSGSSTEKHLNNSANAFLASNSNLIVLPELAPPGSESVTLSAAYVDATAKTEIEVTATASDGGHTFTDGGTVNISGASPAEFSGLHTITSVSGATFKYRVPVKPVTPATGTILASPATTSQFNVTSIAVSGDYNSTNKALVTTSVNHGYADGDLVSISGSARSYFNVTDAIESVTANTFIIDTNVYPKPSSPATAAGTSRVGTNVIATNTQLRRFGRTVVVTVDGGGSQRLDTTWGIVVGAGVTVASATPAGYNSATGQAFTVKAVNQACDGAAYANGAASIGNGEKYMYCYYLVEDEGAVAKAQKILNPVSVASLIRSGTTVTVRTVANHGFANGSNVTISGAGQAQYNGTFNGIGVGADPLQFTYALTAPLVPPDTTISVNAIASPGDSTTLVSAANIVNWIRGVDLREDENANSSFADARTTIHGDVLHSRPVAVNYGGSTGVVVFYGANDGTLRALNGAQTGSPGYAGRERWAFIPKEFLNYSKLTRLVNNEPLIKYPTTPDNLVPTPIKRDYFWDGPVGVLRTTNGDTTLLYVGVRRGGRFIYALDASSVDDPQYLWSLSKDSPGFAELGYTWSLPQPVRFKSVRWEADGSSTIRVRNAVVFGAGYDPSENDKPAGTARTPKMGRGIYVVDAVSGEKIAFLQPPGSIPLNTATAGVYDFAADVTPVDTDADGFVDRIYAVDTGANVWRFDVEQNIDVVGGELESTDDPGMKWKVHKIAALGDVGADGGADDRKVLFAPTVVVFRDADLDRIVAQIFITTGDREAPLDTTINNRVYSIIDTIGYVAADIPDVTVDTVVDAGNYPVTEALAVLQDLTAGETVAAWNRTTNPRGWFFEFNREAGEKGVNAPVLTGGVVFFATNSPTTVDIESGICSNLGNARGYAVSPFTGLPVVDRTGDGDTLDVADYFTNFTGGGLPPTVTSGTVRIVDANGNEVFVPFAIGTGLSREVTGGVSGGDGQPQAEFGSGGSSTIGGGTQGGSTIGGTINLDVAAGRRNRVYWNFEGDE